MKRIIGAKFNSIRRVVNMRDTGAEMYIYIFENNEEQGENEK